MNERRKRLQYCERCDDARYPEKRTGRLEAKLLLAEKLLALQKKASEILGFSLDGDEES